MGLGMGMGRDGGEVGFGCDVEDWGLVRGVSDSKTLRLKK